MLQRTIQRMAAFLGAFPAVCLLLATGLPAAAAGPRSAEEQQEPTSKLEEYGALAGEKLNEIIEAGQKALSGLGKGDESQVDQSIEQLQRVVAAAAERVRRLSDWDIEKIGADAEARFDETIAAVASYLALVKDDGIVHQAALRIRSAALREQQAFGVKAKSKEGEFRDKYQKLADEMGVQAVRVYEIWERIRAQRGDVEELLESLKKYREFYVDVKKAQGVRKAVEELEGVVGDLKRMADAMKEVMRAVLEEA